MSSGPSATLVICAIARFTIVPQSVDAGEGVAALLFEGERSNFQQAGDTMNIQAHWPTKSKCVIGQVGVFSFP